jgi:hypothetical protein
MSARTRAASRGRIFTSTDGKIRLRVKSRPRDKRGHPDKMDVRTVNFTVGRPFRHPTITVDQEHLISRKFLDFGLGSVKKK